MDQQTQRERFDLLEDVLKGLKDEGHRYLFLGAWGAKIDLDSELGKNHPCGTVACVLGSLALDPRAQALGLRLESGSGASDPTQLQVGEPMWVSYDWLMNFDAGEAFFGLRGSDKYELFSPARYVAVREESGDVLINTILDRVRQVRARYGV
jgi:hypothetical protein